MTTKGFSLLEIMLVIGIMAFFSVFGAISYNNLQSTVAGFGFRETESALISAARYARYGESGTNWGLYLPYDETTRATQTVVIFSGANYASRNTAKDIILHFNDAVKFESVNLSGANPSIGNDHEIVFKVFSGATDNYGEILLKAFNATSSIVVSKEGFVTWE